jgi:hypothetical protein
MRRIDLCAVVVACCVFITAGCSRKVDDAPPVATPSMTLGRSDVAIGSPIDVTYAFTVSPTAPAFTDDYTVFVHFLDKDGELLWTDDHEPMPSTRAWTPGATMRYTRQIFIPRFPYVGPAEVELGLYSRKTGARLPMTGQDAGVRLYRVATFTVRPQPEDTVVAFKDGWNDIEMGSPGSGVDWRWSKKAATLAFANPKRGAVLLLDCDEPVDLGMPQHVDVRLGTAPVDSFDLEPGGRQLRTIALAADQLGASPSVELTVSVQTPFVPADIPGLKSADMRELGVRVFHAYLQPK